MVYPRLVAAEHSGSFRHEPFPSGIADLDVLLGGGIDRGTSTILMGPPGTGKSTLAMQYACAAASRGEKVHFIAFDESLSTLVGRGKALGIDLEPFLKSRHLHVRLLDPAEITPGELTHHVQMAVENDNARMVVIDSINGYLNTMPEEKYLTLQLHELLAYLNEQGVVTIMVLAQQGMIGSMQSAVDLTYLADTVILMRYFEAFGEVKQAISVIKKRSGNHERTIREFSLSGKGIQVGSALRDFQGVLSGVPVWHGQEENKMSRG